MKKIIFLLLLFASFWADAQCSMCRASIETTLQSHPNGIGAGINVGILYLLVLPYLLGGFGFWLWWRESRRKKPKNIQKKFFLQNYNLN